MPGTRYNKTLLILSAGSNISAKRKHKRMPIPNGTAQTSARGAEEIDLELFTFVERYATTLFRWDLILFFGARPDAACTSVEIAKQLRRPLYPTTTELDDLTYLHVLVRRYTPERTTYRLSRRAAIRKPATYLANLEQPAAPRESV